MLTAYCLQLSAESLVPFVVVLVLFMIFLVKFFLFNNVFQHNFITLPNFMRLELLRDFRGL